MTEERKTARVYCTCNALVMELPIYDDGSILEPDGTDCDECGSRIYSTIDARDIIHFYADDGECEDVCEVDWPRWALEAYEERTA